MKRSIHSASLLVFLLLLSVSPSAHASRVSLEMGPGTLGMAIGGDLKSGYAMAGISAVFIDDAPWSYVPTRESLTEPCQIYQNADVYPVDPADPQKGDLSVDCDDGKGVFHDGDEWEIYGKLSLRTPGVKRLFFNMGVGISHQKTAELYIFCNGISVPPPAEQEKYPNWRDCRSSEDFFTWGKVVDRYFPTALWGIGLEIRRDLILNLDYHTRRGSILGMTWRF